MRECERVCESERECVRVRESLRERKRESVCERERKGVREQAVGLPRQAQVFTKVVNAIEPLSLSII